MITDIGYVIILGISTFVSTNIDDIFLLILFFSNVLRYPPYQVVIGQYVGISLLVAISIIFSLVSLVIPTFLIGLMGFVPIIIGIKKLIEKHNKEKLMRIDSTNTNSFFLKIKDFLIIEPFNVSIWHAINAFHITLISYRYS
ncbi:MAG: cadmium resistance transporter [Nitrososphaeraceae archaeon]